VKKTIGILGGMGPEATAYFFELIIRETMAACDQEHVPVLIWSNPKIPPRTDAICHKGPSPLPSLLEGIRILERAGAGFIVMPCITAHHWASEIERRASVPFVNLLEESRRYALRAIPGLKRAGLIASSGTIVSRLFHKTFEPRGIEVLTPNPQEQETVMEAIFGRGGIKAGFTKGAPRRLLVGIARRLIGRGAEAIIAGCTEVPLVLKEADLPVPLIEPMKIGAIACLKKARSRIRKSP
jgi:aspartate racemase